MPGQSLRTNSLLTHIAQRAVLTPPPLSLILQCDWIWLLDFLFLPPRRTTPPPKPSTLPHIRMPRRQTSRSPIASEDDSHPEVHHNGDNDDNMNNSDTIEAVSHTDKKKQTPFPTAAQPISDLIGGNPPFADKFFGEVSSDRTPSSFCLALLFYHLQQASGPERIIEAPHFTSSSLPLQASITDSSVTIQTSQIHFEYFVHGPGFVGLLVSSACRGHSWMLYASFVTGFCTLLTQTSCSHTRMCTLKLLCWSALRDSTT